MEAKVKYPFQGGFDIKIIEDDLLPWHTTLLVPSRYIRTEILPDGTEMHYLMAPPMKQCAGIKGFKTPKRRRR